MIWSYKQILTDCTRDIDF